MRNAVASVLVFLGGFVVMVLEIVGARFLDIEFGGSFYVWVSQIGVILAALAVGYLAGGALADRFQRVRFLAVLLVPAGVLTGLIPQSKGLIAAIVGRHPPDQSIPLLWQKLDPVLGSCLIFFLPCLALATLPPFMVRVASRKLAHVGRVSGLVYAASTVGSIAGVFLSGYVLIDHLGLQAIFRLMGVLTVLLGILAAVSDRCFVAGQAGQSTGTDP